MYLQTQNWPLLSSPFWWTPLWCLDSLVGHSSDLTCPPTVTPHCVLAFLLAVPLCPVSAPLCSFTQPSRRQPATISRDARVFTLGSLPALTPTLRMVPALCSLDDMKLYLSSHLSRAQPQLYPSHFSPCPDPHESPDNPLLVNVLRHLSTLPPGSPTCPPPV